MVVGIGELVELVWLAQRRCCRSRLAAARSKLSASKRRIGFLESSPGTMILLNRSSLDCCNLLSVTAPSRSTLVSAQTFPDLRPIQDGLRNLGENLPPELDFSI